jgi:hypothetical protein
MQTLTHGLSCPVIVSPEIDWERDYSRTTIYQLLDMSEEELAAVDPLAMNLIVAKGIPELADLEIGRYQQIVNGWVNDFKRRRLPVWETHFHANPSEFDNDIRYFRLGMVCQYLELEVGIKYKLDQREVTKIYYTNPSDLFLNGVLDTHEGTCGNLSALHVAIGWRQRWPVSLACVKSHYILRYDDGRKTINIEATQCGFGGFKSDPDDYLIQFKEIPQIALSSGSDLRALRPREMLGVFVGLRARHKFDLGRAHNDRNLMLASETDWLLARHLFPNGRGNYHNQVWVTALRGDYLFEPYEIGHSSTHWLCQQELVNRITRPSNPNDPCVLSFTMTTFPDRLETRDYLEPQGVRR